MNKIEVSVICNAYNHENYIRDAIEGFLSQKTNFNFEVLIHDDASTDRTADIIREYEKKYPDIIKPIYQTENQYSKQVRISTKFQYPRAKGKYFAICEGDDFWTDPNKLQKQYDFLEVNLNVDICAHAVARVNAETKKKTGTIAPCNKDVLFSVEQVIDGGGGFVGTNSLMFRREIIENPLPFFDYLSLDYTLQIAGALRGGMYYMTEEMACYRVMAIGSWTYRINKDKSALCSHLERCIQMLEILNEDTKFKYDSVIKNEISRDKIFSYYHSGDYKKIFAKEHRQSFKSLPFKLRVKIFLKAYIPCIGKWFK